MLDLLFLKSHTVNASFYLNIIYIVLKELVLLSGGMGMKAINNVSMGYGSTSQYEKYSKNNKDNKKKGKATSGRIRVHIGFNASGEMARIANANTKTQVAAIERSLRAQLKNAIRYDSDDYTIKAMKRVIGKAGFKVKALGKEERMENLRKSAQAAENRRAEEEIRKELRAKRKARKHKEQAEIASSSSASAKQNSKYVGNHIDVTSEGIGGLEGTPDIAIAEGAMTETIDVSL